MAITKAQALTFTNNRKIRFGASTDSTSANNAKYFFWGFVHLCIQNDLITPAQIMTEFPEFA